MRAVTVSLPGLSINSPTGASLCTQTPGNLLLSMNTPWVVGVTRPREAQSGRPHPARSESFSRREGAVLGQNQKFGKYTTLVNASAKSPTSVNALAGNGVGHSVPERMVGNPKALIAGRLQMLSREEMSIQIRLTGQTASLPEIGPFVLCGRSNGCTGKVHRPPGGSGISANDDLVRSGTATLFVLFPTATGTELVSTRFGCLQPDCLPA